MQEFDNIDNKELNSGNIILRKNKSDIVNGQKTADNYDNVEQLIN